MAQFDNVNYNYYSNTLGRAVIPSESEFNRFKLVNIQEMKRLIPYIEELETNGIDNAVCMMIEADYRSDGIKAGTIESAINSETLGGHSVSYGERGNLATLDAKSTDSIKMDMIKLFNRVNIGLK